MTLCKLRWMNCTDSMNSWIRPPISLLLLLHSSWLWLNHHVICRSTRSSHYMFPSTPSDRISIEEQQSENGKQITVQKCHHAWMRYWQDTEDEVLKNGYRQIWVVKVVEKRICSLSTVLYPLILLFNHQVLLSLLPIHLRVYRSHRNHNPIVYQTNWWCYRNSPEEASSFISKVNINFRHNLWGGGSCWDVANLTFFCGGMKRFNRLIGVIATISNDLKSIVNYS